jgi:twitching motility two-component system response regulator PilH
MRNVPKILIIDDSTTLCQYMTQILQQANYLVITASSGQEGLTKVQREHPHCLILDAILPDIGGFEVCRKVRTSDPMHLLPIIMMSSKNTTAEQYWGLRQGATRYLGKPFTEEALLTAVREVLPIYSHRPVTREQARQMPLQQYQPPAHYGQLPLAKLIPRRVENIDIMWTSRPNAALIADREARFLYIAIDGRKNIERLCLATGMSTEDISRALRVLLSLQRIQLCDPSGKVVDSAQFFTDL